MLILRVNSAAYIPVIQEGMQKASLIQIYFSYPLFVLSGSILCFVPALFGRVYGQGYAPVLQYR